MRVFNNFESALASFAPGCLNNILQVDVARSATTSSTVINKHATEQPITYVSPYQTEAPSKFFSANFDRNNFAFSFYTPAVRLPAEQCKEFMSLAKKLGSLLEVEKIRTIVNDIPVTYYPTNHALEHTTARPTHKRLLLSFPLPSDLPQFTNETSESSSQDLPLELVPYEELRELVAQYSNQGAAIVLHRLVVGYEFFTVDHALRSLLPQGLTVPSSFVSVGHIAQMNLRDEQLPFKYVIGQVILDKNLALQTVVNKLGNINNVYRNFAAEVIAGKPSLVTRLKEHNAIFEFDFGEVYWNSRLQTEHGRIVRLAADMAQGLAAKPKEKVSIGKKKQDNPTKNQKQSNILDLFAGIGPFAIPAGQLNSNVFANDLNPRSSHYMFQNVVLNKVENNVRVYNMDAREMFRAVVRVQFEQFLIKKASAAGVQVLDSIKTKSVTNGMALPWFDHIVMNLPATAQEFCDVFTGSYNIQSIDDLKKLPALPTPFNKAGDTTTTLSLTEQELETLKDVQFPSFDELEQSDSFVFPIVHCYCFARNSKDLVGNAIQMCEEYLTYRISLDDSVTQDRNEIFYMIKENLSIAEEPKTYSHKLVSQIKKHGVYVHNVRDVAPNKEMMCVSFILRKDILLGLESSAKGEYTYTVFDKIQALEGQSRELPSQFSNKRQKTE